MKRVKLRPRFAVQAYLHTFEQNKLGMTSYDVVFNYNSKGTDLSHRTSWSQFRNKLAPICTLFRLYGWGSIKEVNCSFLVTLRQSWQFQRNAIVWTSCQRSLQPSVVGSCNPANHPQPATSMFNSTLFTTGSGLELAAGPFEIRPVSSEWFIPCY